ncbi:MAG: hypothetical protein AVDCRST_MAG68-4152, partial [uncultured Gemmatimonadetes bacterium]
WATDPRGLTQAPTSPPPPPDRWGRRRCPHTRATNRFLGACSLCIAWPRLDGWSAPRSPSSLGEGGRGG